jgi:penicillin-binding protein 1C
LLQAVARSLPWLALVALLAAYVTSVAARAHLDDPAPTPIVYDRNGRFLAQFGDVEDGRTDYGFWHANAPPPRVVQATLALEDRRFWSHPGVDPAAVLRAIWQRLRGARTRSGASTIAMQVARMQHPAARTIWAKAVEAGTALALTARYAAPTCSRSISVCCRTATAVTGSATPRAGISASRRAT